MRYEVLGSQANFDVRFLFDYKISFVTRINVHHAQRTHSARQQKPAAERAAELGESKQTFYRTPYSQLNIPENN